MKKTVSRVLALTLSAGMAMTGCIPALAEETSGDTYTYVFTEADSPTTWNTHDEAVVENITGYTEISLWNLVLNEDADGYEYIPEMADGEPEDITASLAGDKKWGDSC